MLLLDLFLNRTVTLPLHWLVFVPVLIGLLYLSLRNYNNDLPFRMWNIFFGGVTAVYVFVWGGIFWW